MRKILKNCSFLRLNILLLFLSFVLSTPSLLTMVKSLVIFYRVLVKFLTAVCICETRESFLSVLKCYSCSCFYWKMLEVQHFVYHILISPVINQSNLALSLLFFSFLKNENLDKLFMHDIMEMKNDNKHQSNSPSKRANGSHKFLRTHTTFYSLEDFYVVLVFLIVTPTVFMQKCSFLRKYKVKF